MEELLGNIVEKTGLDQDTAREAVAIILGFLSKNGPQERMQQIFEALPGAEALVAAKDAADASQGSGLLGGLSSMMPGMGAMAALNELTSAGLDMDQVQSVVRQLVDIAKEKAGDEVVEDVISKIPGLNQLVE